MKNARVGLIVVLSTVFVAQGFAAPDESAVAKGEKVYQKWCFPCHGTGSGKPATDLLAARDKGTRPAALEERTDLTAPVIKQFVRRGVMFMPTFRKTEISDADLDALSAYLMRNNKR
jgi:mono/diheme cytochrome c family protein